jgi:hypothetical protein
VPKLLERTKRIRHKRFLTALQKTGSNAKAALEVLNIGSKGGKDINAIAAAAGAQMLQRVKGTLVDALERRGVNADKIAERVDDLLDSQDPQYIDKGITQSAKMGVGGGYAPEKSINVNVEVEANPKIKELAEKLNALYRNGDSRSDGIAPSTLGDKAPDKE